MQSRAEAGLKAGAGARDVAKVGVEARPDEDPFSKQLRLLEKGDSLTDMH